MTRHTRPATIAKSRSASVWATTPSFDNNRVASPPATFNRPRSASQTLRLHSRPPFRHYCLPPFQLSAPARILTGINHRCCRVLTRHLQLLSRLRFHRQLQLLRPPIIRTNRPLPPLSRTRPEANTRLPLLTPPSPTFLQIHSQLCRTTRDCWIANLSLITISTSEVRPAHSDSRSSTPTIRMLAYPPRSSQENED